MINNTFSENVQHVKDGMNQSFDNLSPYTRVALISNIFIAHYVFFLKSNI